MHYPSSDDVRIATEVLSLVLRGEVYFDTEERFPRECVIVMIVIHLAFPRPQPSVRLQEVAAVAAKKDVRNEALLPKIEKEKQM